MEPSLNQADAPATAKTFQPDLAVLQKICDTLAAQDPCDISIMAGEGRGGVASSIEGRQGQHHEGARRILAGEVGVFEVTTEVEATRALRDSDNRLKNIIGSSSDWS